MTTLTTNRKIKNHKPCHCDICMQDRWQSECVACKYHDSFWKTVVQSPQWLAWEKEQRIRQGKKNLKGCFDYDECRECGWISQDHFQEFIKFIKFIKKQNENKRR